ncbi:MAG: sulfite exporter TauE/SafE family protein [Phycisphaerae bacterium]|nr:sulfite exporter TauE/SafE family protein [Phycisphaerae bacterium]
MFGLSLPEYEIWQWAALCLCAVFAGMSKTGLPGLGILMVPLMAGAFAAKASTGMLLPLLAFADLFAVGYYHRHAKWSHVLRLLPWALAGIGAGFLITYHVKIPDTLMKPLIGGIVLTLLAVNFWRQRRGDAMSIPAHWAFAASLGFFAGLTTQLANAAGPVMVLYLLAMRLPKHEFIGTSAWYFLILNYLKIPLFVYDGRITWESIRTDVVALPFILVGVAAGIWLLKRIPQKAFNVVVQILATLAAAWLIASVWMGK